MAGAASDNILGDFEDGVDGWKTSGGNTLETVSRSDKPAPVTRGKSALAVTSDVITEAHVRQADEIVERDKVRDELTRLPTQSKLTLYSLLLLEREDETPSKRNRIYERYVMAAKRIDADVRTDRTIHDRLSQLTLKGFLDVDEQNKGPKGGSYYEYEFSIRADLAQEVLQEDERLVELFATDETSTTLDSF